MSQALLPQWKRALFSSSRDNWGEVYYYQLGRGGGQVVISGGARYTLFIRDTRSCSLSSLFRLPAIFSTKNTKSLFGAILGHSTSFPHWSAQGRDQLKHLYPLCPPLPSLPPSSPRSHPPPQLMAGDDWS